MAIFNVNKNGYNSNEDMTVASLEVNNTQYRLGIDANAHSEIA